MKKVIVTLYPYAELSEAAKAKALASLDDLNTKDNWYEIIYEDAAKVGLKISGFDLMSRNTITYNVCVTASDMAKLILGNHGEECETHKLAKAFIFQRDRIVKAGEKINADILETMEQGFIEQIGKEYWNLLGKEYDYLTSTKAIEESIEANEYLFTVDGRVFSTKYKEI